MAKKSNLFDDLKDGLEDAAKWHRGQVTLRTSDLNIPDKPEALSKAAIKNIRINKLNMSQGVLAKYLGVNDSTVKHWEHGISSPKGPSLRLLRIAQNDPELFQELIINIPHGGRKKSVG